MITFDELQTNHRMPFGRARTAASRATARTAEGEGPAELLPLALEEYIQATVFADQDEPAFAPFSRLLRLWDDHQELFDDGTRHSLFWQFKWVGNQLADYPQISRPQAEEFLDDMERRFRLEGLGMSAVASTRFYWLRDTGSDGAEEARLEWTSTPRDEMSDCAACTIGEQVEHLLDRGRYEEAVKLGLSQTGRCAEEPTRTHHLTALAALRAGDAQVAADQYRLALASLGEDTVLPGCRGAAFELLATGGLLSRALRDLRGRDMRYLEGRDLDPLCRLSFLTGLLAGLSASLDRGETPTGLERPGWATVAELHDWARTTACHLAEQFDRRNGNTWCSRRVDDALGTRPSGLTLDLGVPAGLGADDGDPSAPSPTSALPTGSEPDAPGAGAPQPEDPDVLFGRAESLAGSEDFPAASPIYFRAAGGFRARARLDAAGLTLAEAAQCAARAGDRDRAARLFDDAVPLLEAGGARDTILAQVLSAWTVVAADAEDGTAGRLLAACRRLMGRLDDRARDNAADVTADQSESDDRPESDDLAARRRSAAEFLHAFARGVLARAMSDAATDDEQSERAAEEFRQAAQECAAGGHIPDAAVAFWSAGRVERRRRDTTSAIYCLESAFEAWEIQHDLEQQAKVADDLLPILDDAGLAERSEALVRRLQG